jgi:RNA polymerase sigma-70 factor, ECF subfamily
VDPLIPGVAGRATVHGEPPLSGPDERTLVAEILRNDRKAAARFVAAHVDAVYAYARHRLAPRADLVDDVVQDVFLAALNSLTTYQGQSSLRAWLLGIARHKVEDVYRQRLRAPAALEEGTAAETETAAPAAFDEAIDADRAKAKARRVLAQLPERYGLVLLWRYWEQRSTRDMAAAIGTTEKSVERLLARARARFKALWSQEQK